MTISNKYIEVILPLPVEGSFTYSLRKEDQSVSVGQRVIVQFGVRKLYTAIVVEVHNRRHEGYNIKEILGVLDEDNVISPLQIDFWRWISSYYMCKIGEVMHVALPSSLKLASESKIIIHPDFDGDIDMLNDNEMLIVEELTVKESLLIQDIVDLLNKTSVFSIINELIRKEIIQIKEEIYDIFKVKVIQMVKLVAENHDDYFESVKSAKQQEKLLKFLIEQHEKYPRKKWSVVEVLKKSGISRPVLKSLERKGIVKIMKEEVSRLISQHQQIEKLKDLSIDQQSAYSEINRIFRQKDVCLLHGVTSSGKTEIYIKLIQEQLDQGKQVLYLVPEIVLTAQIINRLKKHFGEIVGVYHSHLSSSERVEVWNAVKQKDKNRVRYRVVIGARSSLFLPFIDLGLIVVDEEHEPSLKQLHPAPRYHARDASIYLASLHESKVLLGSATPSLETYYNAKKGKFGLVEIHSRFGDVPLPEIHVVDIKKAHLKKQMTHHFSPFLLSSMSESLELGKQVILFQNRRGYSPILQCNTCSWTPVCKNCDVSLTYHKHVNSLRCHYCGYDVPRLLNCDSCGDQDMIDKGFGTEQIEEDIRVLFPDAVTKRMDYDTTRRKNAYRDIIDEFERGNIDILIGTQMVTKGLDFDNVKVVGILNADSMLKFPDFRSLERSYQLMSQVAGRAGRKGSVGKVIIQTYDAKNKIINQVRCHNYNLMYQEQLEERGLFRYPPYVRMISINLQHKNNHQLDILSEQFASSLKKSFGRRVLGPEYPSISKLRGYYHKDVLLKIELDSSVSMAKDIILRIINRYQNIREFRAMRININVDPI